MHRLTWKHSSNFFSWLFNNKCCNIMKIEKKCPMRFGRTLFLLNGQPGHQTCFRSQQATTSKSWFHAHVPGIEGDAEYNCCAWIMHRRSLFKDKILIRALPQGPAGCLPEVWVLLPSLWMQTGRRKPSELRLTDIKPPNNKGGLFCHGVLLQIKLPFLNHKMRGHLLSSKVLPCFFHKPKQQWWTSTKRLFTGWCQWCEHFS